MRSVETGLQIEAALDDIADAAWAAQRQCEHILLYIHDRDLRGISRQLSMLTSCVEKAVRARTEIEALGAVAYRPSVPEVAP